jgi:murein peptide amidase A
MISRFFFSNKRVTIIFLAAFLIVCAVHKPSYPPFAKSSYDHVVKEWLQRFSSQQHADSLILLGQSTQDRPIWSHRFGHGSTTALVMGGIHGDEHSSVWLTAMILDTLAFVDLDSVTVYVIPVANPDGLVKNTRQNANHVDLNRNFPTANWQPNADQTSYAPGPAPASEIETKILIDFFDEFHPELIITAHAPLACVNYDGPSEHYANIMSEMSGYPAKSDIGYPTPGSMGTYTGDERQIPTITFELQKIESPERMLDHVKAILAALKLHQKRIS